MIIKGDPPANQFEKAHLIIIARNVSRETPCPLYPTGTNLDIESIEEEVIVLVEGTVALLTNWRLPPIGKPIYPSSS